MALIVFGVLVVGAVMAGAILYVADQTGAQATQAVSQVAANELTTQSQAVTAADVFAAYEANELAADQGPLVAARAVTNAVDQLNIQPRVRHAADEINRIAAGRLLRRHPELVAALNRPP